MNMKVVSMCLICAGALLTGCGNGGKKEAETSERKEKEAVVGSDKDEHGCIASAGNSGPSRSACRWICLECGR